MALTRSFSTLKRQAVPFGAATCALIEVEYGIFEEQDYLNQERLLDLDVAFKAREVQELLGTFCESAKNDQSGTLLITGSTSDGAVINSGSG